MAMDGVSDREPEVVGVHLAPPLCSVRAHPLEHTVNGSGGHLLPLTVGNGPQRKRPARAFKTEAANFD